MTQTGLKTYHYYSNCVDWPRHDVRALTDMCDSGKPLSRQAFLRHVDREELWELERSLGYVRNMGLDGLTMGQDWAVQYFKGKLHSRRVYYFTWSAIEYVFTQSKETA